MQRFLLLMTLLFIMNACNYRIYTNGHFDHLENGLSSHWKSKNDSCFVFEPDEPLPDSLIYINQSEFLSPFVWPTTFAPDYVMKNKAMDQAQRIGANIVQKIDDDATKFTRYRYVTRMYYLREPFMTDYKHKSDSIQLALKKINSAFCILHIKSYMDKWINTPIYFDDSLSGHCHGATRKKGGFDIHRLDLKVERDGILSDRNNRVAKHKNGVHVKKGKEYYINLIGCKSHGVCFISVNKEHF